MCVARKKPPRTVPSVSFEHHSDRATMALNTLLMEHCQLAEQDPCLFTFFYLFALGLKMPFSCLTCLFHEDYNKCQREFFKMPDSLTV